MNSKTLFIALICAISFTSANAQDEIHKKNGKVLDAKVVEVTPKVISYKKDGNPDGPTYKIDKGDVAKIVYDNGTEDNFSAPRQGDDQPARRKSVKYGNNIIGVMPMQITSNVGVGISYERVIDQAGILSFYMPVTVAFANNNSFNTTPAGTSTGDGESFYIMPGLKFYPTGSKGVVRYAVGPNLAYITGQKYVNNFIYDNSGNIIGQDIGMRTHSALGIMVTNSLNINPTAHLHLGMELGLGFTYFNKLNNINQNTEAIAQFGFKIGYRF